MYKNGNNLYVKCIPDDWGEQMLLQKFGTFGNIKSLKLDENQYGQFAFICFDGPDGQDKVAGLKSADAAQKAMH